ncbi:MAG: hypothetical protein R3C18_12685 [Planctomycetaceae bacterium]
MRSTSPYRHDETFHVPLWLEAAEPRIVLDAAAALVGGELLVTGDAGTVIDDYVTLAVFDDGMGHEFLQILDHGTPIDIDLGMGMSPVTDLPISDITAGRIQIDLGTGDDALHLQIPSAVPLGGGLDVIVNDGDGIDSVDIQNSSSLLDIEGTHLNIESDQISFDSAFAETLIDVDFQLTGELSLQSDLDLSTGGGDFQLLGDVHSGAGNNLLVDTSGGMLSIDGMLGDVGQELGTVDLDAGMGSLSIGDVLASGDVSLSATQINLHGNVSGNELLFDGDVFTHDSLDLTATGGIDASMSIFRPTVDGLNISFAATGDIHLGGLEINLGTLPASSFGDVDILSGNDFTLGQSEISGALTVGDLDGTTEFLGSLSAGSVHVLEGAILNGDVTTVAEQSYGALLLNQDVLLTAQDVTVSGEVESALGLFRSLSINATGQVELNSTAAPGSGRELGALNISGFQQLEILGPTAVQGSIDLNGQAILLDGNISTGSGGNLSIDNSGQLVVGNAAVFTLDGALDQIGSGAVSLGGDIATNNATIAFNGPVTLTDDVSLETGATGASITFHNTLDDVAAQAHSIGLNTGTAGDITFTMDVGQALELGAVNVTLARDVFLLGQFLTVAFQQLNGTGATHIDGTLVTSGSSGVSISSNDIEVTGRVESQSTGTVTLLAANDVTLTSSAEVVSDAGNIQLIADSDMVCDGTSGAVTMADGAVVMSQTGSIEVRADETILVSSLSTGHAGGPAITVTSKNGQVLDAGDTNVDLVANSAGAVVAVTSRFGIGSGDALETNVDTFAGAVTDFGTLQIHDLGDITIAAAQTTGGNILIEVDGNLQATNASISPGTGTSDLQIIAVGDIDLGTLGNALATTDGDNIDLQAGGTITLPDAGVNVGSGNLNLQGDTDIVDPLGRDLGLLVAQNLQLQTAADGGSLTLQTNVDVLNIDLTTAASGTGVSVVEQDAVEIQSIVTNDGKVSVTAADSTAGDLTIHSIDAGTADVSLTISNSPGAIIDGSETEIDIVAGTLTLLSRNGIGSGNPLELQVSQLNAENLVSGNIDLHNTVDLQVARAIQSGTGDLNIIVDGTLKTLPAMTMVPNVSVTSGNLHLQTTGVAGDIRVDGYVASTSGNIEIESANELKVSPTGTIASGGDLTLTSVANTTISGMASSSGGNVVIDSAVMLRITGTGSVMTDTGLLRLSTTSGNLQIDGTVSSNSGPINVDSGASLQVTGTGSVTSAGPVSLTSTNNVAIDAGGVVRSTGEDVTLNSGGSTFIAGEVSSPVGSLIVSSTGNLEVADTGVLTTDAELLRLITTTGDMLIAGQVTSNTGPVEVESGGSLRITPTGVVTTEGTLLLTADASLTVETGASVQSFTNRVDLVAGGDVVLGTVQSPTLINVTSTGGAIENGQAGGGPNLIAPELVLRSSQGIGNNAPLQTQTELLALDNSAAGKVQIENSTRAMNPLTLGTVDGLVGITNTGDGDGGIAISNEGAIIVDAFVFDTNGGGITLDAIGADSDLTVNAPLVASIDLGLIQLTAGRNLILNDTGFADDILAREIIGEAGNEVQFDEFSGVTVRSATGSVVSPVPRLENLLTPQIGADGVSHITAEFGHAGAANFYFMVLWDPAFIDRFDAAPASFDGAPIFGLNNSALPPGTMHQNLPPEFAAALQVLIARQQEVGTGVSFDGYDPLALQKQGTAPYLGESTFAAAKFYGANPNKDVPYDPSADIPITVHIWDDGNITFIQQGQDLGQAEVSGEAGVPGDGLQGGVFFFDLSIEVPPLEAPRTVVNDAAIQTTTDVIQDSGSEEIPVIIADTVSTDEEVLIIEKVAKDGTIARLPNGQPIRREIHGAEVFDTISDLPDLYDRLHEGHWRIYLKPGAEAQPQLIRDVELREGRPAGGDIGTQDRPPTSSAPETSTPVEDSNAMQK